MASFYEKLYEGKDTLEQKVYLQKNIDDQSQIELNNKISNLEVEKVIDSLKVNSAPGPDSLTTNFYKNFKGEITPNLVTLFNVIMEGGKVPDSWKYSEIITIPKPNKDDTDPNNYRPISLSNVDYKIFTKILSNRIKEKIPKIIYEDQYGFIKNRKIADPIRNILNTLNHTTANSSKLLILKLDFHKAFDSINHKYLSKICEASGMGEKICNVLKEIYSGNKAVINVNGINSRQINIKRGTKQGCPLSPSLFALAIEPLANLIGQDQTIKGYKVGKEEIKINLYVDDTMIILSEVKESLSSLVKLIKEFWEISGLEINLGKTEFLHKNLSLKELGIAQNIIGVKLGKKSLKYLGIEIPKKIK
ncbi:V-set and immunoglobulin domain-containing protein 1 isoform X1 [Anolis carolinensis]|uniref:V-set and immunoglobulin domain-containing protein 1 isoform X1 n=1 Tax=Anolis carolinensis TaxID=28377 RepID=UPI002F2B6E8F